MRAPGEAQKQAMHRATPARALQIDGTHEVYSGFASMNDDRMQRAIRFEPEGSLPKGCFCVDRPIRW